MTWLRVSRLAQTSGIGPHQMLRRLKRMNAQVGGRLLRREGESGIWQVSESVLVEIREAERARQEETEDSLGWSEITDRVRELETTLLALQESYRDHRRRTNSTLKMHNSRLDRIEASKSRQLALFPQQEHSRPPSEPPPSCAPSCAS